MDESELQSDLGGHDPAAQHPVERAGQTDKAADALRAAGAGHDSSSYFGVAVAEVAVLADPQIAGERQFESSAQRVAVHGGNDDLGQRHHVVEHRLVTTDDGSGVSGQARVAGAVVRGYKAM